MTSLQGLDPDLSIDVDLGCDLEFGGVAMSVSLSPEFDLDLWDDDLDFMEDWDTGVDLSLEESLAVFCWTGSDPDCCSDLDPGLCDLDCTVELADCG